MNGGPGFAFHHFGLAVADPARALAFLAQMGFACGSRVSDPLQRVDLVWCSHAQMPSVELVIATDPDGPLRSVLAQAPSSFYHLCWEVPGIDAAVAHWTGSGLRVATVRAPLPAILFGGRRVSFHMVQGFGLVELLEAA